MGHDPQPTKASCTHHQGRSSMCGSSCVTTHGTRPNKRPLQPVPSSSTTTLASDVNLSDISMATTTCTNSKATKLVTQDHENPAVSSPTSPHSLVATPPQAGIAIPCPSSIQCGGVNSSAAMKLRCSSKRKLCYCELRLHNTRESCWLLVDGKIYDVTTILQVHPGGEESILRKAGGQTDCAKDMQFHSQMATNLLKKCLLGNLQPCGESSATTQVQSEKCDCMLKEVCTIM